MSVPCTHLNNSNKLPTLFLCFLQLDSAFLGPLGTPWQSTQVEVVHALGRVHIVGRAVFLDVELTGPGLQHLPTKIAFPLFHPSHRFLIWWSVSLLLLKFQEASGCRQRAQGLRSFL